MLDVLLFASLVKESAAATHSAILESVILAVSFRSVLSCAGFALCMCLRCTRVSAMLHMCVLVDVYEYAPKRFGTNVRLLADLSIATHTTGLPKMSTDK